MSMLPLSPWLAERTAREMACGRCRLRMRDLLDRYPDRLSETYSYADACYMVSVKDKQGQALVLKCPKGYADDKTIGQIILVLG